MNAVETYLATPAPERLYSAGLELFRQHGYSKWPQLWERLQLGPLGRNREILETHLKQLSGSDLSAAVIPPKPVEIVIKKKPVAEETVQPGVLEYDLLKKIRHQRQNRMRHSQSFHNCKTDEERALVCDAIQAENDLIRELSGKIAYVQRFGKLPPEPEPEEFVLPLDLKELSVMLNRHSSNILKVEKRIDILLDLPEKDKKRADLPAKYDQLRELQTRRELIKDKIKELRNGVENRK